MKLLIILFSICTLSLSVSANALHINENDSLLNEVLDEMLLERDNNIDALIDGAKAYHFLYLNTSYSNKTMSAGREIGSNASNYSGQLYYFISNGLYFGISGAWYTDFEPHYQSTPVVVGYSNGGKYVRYRASYSRYFYHLDDYDPLFSNSVSMGVTLRKKWAGVRVDYSYLFGQEDDNKLSLVLYSEIELWKFKRRNKITLDPQLGFYMGTETVESEIIIGDDELYPIYNTEDLFGWMNTQFSVPLSFSFGDFSLELEYTYNIPRSLDPNFSYPNSHLFNVSLGYIISLN